MFPLPRGALGNLRVGLFGGSFNPPHLGHKYVAVHAIKKLKLHKLIWLVAQQNPHKPADSYICSYEQRYAMSEDLVDGLFKINVSSFEKEIHSPYTFETIARLKKIYQNIEFIWIMGADCMISMHKWHKWNDIFKEVFVAVFDREECLQKLISSKTFNIVKDKLIKSDLISNILSIEAGKWSFFRIQRLDISSTNIRDCF